MKSTVKKVTVLIVLLSFLVSLFSGCAASPETRTYDLEKYASFLEIPGVTEEERAAVEALLAQRDSFIFGTIPSTEAFYDADGNIAGFVALLCDWMTDLFGVPFEPRFYEWNELLLGLETGDIDFTSELTPTEARREAYFMTDGIAERSVSAFRLRDSLPFQMIELTRPLRFGFLSGAVTFDDVSAWFEGEFEAVFVDEYEEAYASLISGDIDAFLEENTAAAVFDTFDNVTHSVFYPLIHATVSLTAQNPANEPIIAVMQRAIEQEGLRMITKLYNLGELAYNKHNLFLHLTEEERDFIRNSPVIKFVAKHDNYPVSFHNVHYDEFQGIAHDVIREIETLTGLQFELINDRYTELPEILRLLETGEASIITELVRTPSRKGRFLWPQAAVLVDYHALISKTELPNIRTNEILQMKVGLVEGYVHTEVFNQWFPYHRNTVLYHNFDQAFSALHRDEIDLVMGSYDKLLYQTNFREQPGYKANIVFDYPYESTFGFHLSETVLCSIVDKALQIIDTETITGQWLRRTYDYWSVLQQQQIRQELIGVIGMSILFFCVIFLFYLTSAKRRLEAESKYKSSFLATMSHEIRTPLNAVIGVAQIEMQKPDIPHEYASAFDKIYGSGSSLLGIINDILDMSKIETGKLSLNPSEYDIPSLVNDTVQLNIVRIGSKPIEFILEADENLPTKLYGDEVRLKQILNNLLSNAIKYTEKGFVKLSIKHWTDEGDIMLSFSVEDTGQGMKSEDRLKLFSEYQRFNAEANRTTEGTGLGLSITKKLVGMMDGTILVESEYGKGSLFLVTVRQKAVECAAIGAELAEQLSHFTFVSSRQAARLQVTRELMPYGSVLIVDDVETNLYVAQGLLAPYQLRIDTAYSGFETIEKVESGNVYDIIFMDHMMPQMDGIETTQRLRALGYTGVIVALTANALVGSDEVFKQNGFDGFVSKPVDVRHLNAILNMHIRDKYPEQAKQYKPETVTQLSAPPVDARVLQAFRGDAERAAVTLRETLEAGDVSLFTTTAHAMKSALANVGEQEASALAAALEAAGQKKDMDYLLAHTEPFVETLHVLISRFTPAATTSAEPEVTTEDTAYLSEQLLIIKTACEAYDDDAVYATLDRLSEKQWTRETADALEKIRDAMFIYSDFDGAAEMAEKLMNQTSASLTAN